ncbi:hypothetical protein D3C74_379190 [compost metagenome]
MHSHGRGELLRQGRVDLDRDDARPHLEQAQREGSQARSDLDHPVPRPDPGGPDDLADGPAVVHEVLPEGLGGPHAQTPRQVADLCRTEQGVGGVVHAGKPTGWTGAGRRERCSRPGT